MSISACSSACRCSYCMPCADSLVPALTPFFRADSPYALLLLAKLCLFACMLIMAGLNRYRLTPALEHAIGPNGWRWQRRGCVKACCWKARLR